MKYVRAKQHIEHGVCDEAGDAVMASGFPVVLDLQAGDERPAADFGRQSDLRQLERIGAIEFFER